jgi:hypothetical protein
MPMVQKMGGRPSGKEEIEEGKEKIKEQFYTLGCALAVNPNTPITILTRLSQDFISQVAQNPALPLLLVEDWYFLSEITLWNMVSSTFPSHSVLQMLAHHTNAMIAQEVQMHVTFSGEADENWRDAAGPLLAKLPYTSAERYFLNKFQQGEFARVPEWIWIHLPAHKGRAPIAKKPPPMPKPHPEPWNADSLAQIQNAKTTERMNAVRDSQNAEFLKVMSKDQNANVRGLVACNPYTPVEILRGLAIDSFPVRRSLVKNPNTPEDLLKPILKELPIFSYEIHKHDHAPAWALEIAWNYRPSAGPRNNPTLRKLLLENPETSFETQHNVFFSPSTEDSQFKQFINTLYLEDIQDKYGNLPWWEKIAYILNPNVSEEVIQPLITQDPNRYVRAAARERLGES